MAIRNTKAERIRQSGGDPSKVKSPKPPRKPELEKSIQKKIITYLESLGAVVTRVNSGYIQTDAGHFFRGADAGTSDLQVCLWGVPLAIETKRPGEKATLAQLHFLERWRAAGGVGFVTDSVADTQMKIERLRGDPRVKFYLDNYFIEE